MTKGSRCVTCGVKTASEKSFHVTESKINRKQNFIGNFLETERSSFNLPGLQTFIKSFFGV